jgi:anti-sigma B factor antagonist
LNSSHDNPLEITTQDDVLIVSFRQTCIHGIAHVENVADVLRSMIDEKQPRKLVIDFSQVRFFSSQVLGLLVDIWRRVKDFGGSLTISGIDPQLTRVFRITHLDKLFTFHENTDSAVASMKAF